MKIVTHSGDFHADDLFAVAVLKSVYPEAEIIRTRNPQLIGEGDIVVDVGGIHDDATMRFDHHQVGGAGVRGNGIPYASFGLVWNMFGERVAGGKEEARLIEEELVIPVDAKDSGISIVTPLFENILPFDITDFLKLYVNDEDKDEDHQTAIFISTLPIATDILQRVILKASKNIKAAREIEEIYSNAEDKRLIILEKGLPWKKTLVLKPEPLYVVFPTFNGGWGIQAVPKSVIGFENRKSFPEAWAGKIDEELEKVTGVQGAKFCHNSLFYAVAENKEAALKLAEIALNA
ncbi:MAG: hypothetical protein JWL80_288 [Parcubacteria group bacterium]|nr:hypothetical protein [Parcubacteria group bacterium]